ncbi:hypothetical protein [Neobacillus bataviensis]|uniref:hypothetical protein n=1 Tax=Neobacillus bataviensis TaxID=220685 RepID=UPI001CBF4D61|nr:hypothetical protein [Neobacillus bataviensis]
MVRRFKNEEEAYEKWCKEHENGYIFNNAGGKTGNVLHLVGCRHLTSARFIGKYTKCYPKYCSDNLNELIEKADKVSQQYGWRQCKACF